MAVESVTEIFSNRGGPTGEKDTDVRTFQVITTSGKDTKYTIHKSGLVPLRGASHHTEAHLFCKNVDTQQDTTVRSPRHWIHKAEYDNQPFSALPQLSAAIEPHPLLRGVEIEGHSIVGRRSREVGLLIATKTLAEWQDGKGEKIPAGLSPLETTAGEAFEGLEEDDIQYVVRVAINAETVQDWLQPYQGCLNNDVVTVRGYARPFPRWSLKIVDFSHSNLLSEKLPNGTIVNYYKTRFGLHFKRKLWVTPIQNKGYYYLKNGRRKLILDDGVKATRAKNLDKNGEVVTSTNEGVLYRFYADGPDVDFSVFKLSL